MSQAAYELKEERYTRKVMEAAIRVGIVALLALWSFSIFKPCCLIRKSG